MRVFQGFLIVCLAVALAGAQAQPPAKSYTELVTQAESGDAATDYSALRTAYAVSEGYDPYGAETRDGYIKIWPAFQKKDCDTVIKVSDEMLKSDYTLATIHVMRSDCMRTKGDTARADREEAIGRGLVASLRGSGDGKSVKTAFVIVTMSEERFLLVGMGLHEEKQSLLNDNGHMYDLIEGKNENADGPGSAYFNVDALFAGMTRKFQKAGSPTP